MTERLVALGEAPVVQNYKSGGTSMVINCFVLVGGLEHCIDLDLDAIGADDCGAAALHDAVAGELSLKRGEFKLRMVESGALVDAETMGQLTDGCRLEAEPVRAKQPDGPQAAEGVLPPLEAEVRNTMPKVLFFNVVMVVSILALYAKASGLIAVSWSWTVYLMPVILWNVVPVLCKSMIAAIVPLSIPFWIAFAILLTNLPEMIFLPHEFSWAQNMVLVAMLAYKSEAYREWVKAYVLVCAIMRLDAEREEGAHPIWVGLMSIVVLLDLIRTGHQVREVRRLRGKSWPSLLLHFHGWFWQPTLLAMVLNFEGYVPLSWQAQALPLLGTYLCRVPSMVEKPQEIPFVFVRWAEATPFAFSLFTLLLYVNDVVGLHTSFGMSLAVCVCVGSVFWVWGGAANFLQEAINTSQREIEEQRERSRQLEELREAQSNLVSQLNQLNRAREVGPA